MAALSARSLAVDAAVIITEIQYNPGAGDTEWVELHSLTGVDIDLSGWRLTSGVEFTIPVGTKIPGHGYLIIAADPGAQSLQGLNAIGGWSGNLSNGGETVRLVNRDSREMDVLDYKDSGDWPAGSDGSGASLARRNSESAAEGPTNWASSADIRGTPGRTNFANTGQGPTVSVPTPLDASWKYFVGTPAAGWEQPAFDDTSWTSAPSALYSGSPVLGGGSDGLRGYWPLDETTGTTAANLAPSGNAATLVNSPQWISDTTRGRCIRFAGSNQYVNAGSATIPQMTLANDFTWSFWALSEEAASSDVVIGNRFSPTAGVDWNPREFIKFTPTQFEFQRSAIDENIDYADLPNGGSWIHHAVVKAGSQLTYFRNGVVGGTRTITQGLNHPQPLYFGGEQNGEYWTGRLDDVAIWTKALSSTEISSLTAGTDTPLTVTAPASLRTQLPASPTYAFRRTFAYTGTPSRTALTLRLLVDDGCTVWLNGTQVYTQNNPPVSGVGSANLSADISIPSSALIRGDNVLAVQVSTFASEPDMVFAAELTATELPPTPSDTTPGLVFSEFGPAGVGFQVELTNTSGGAIDLTGYVIKSSTGATANLAGTINAGAYLVFDTAQLGFIPVSGDKLFLCASGGVAVLDAREVTNRLRGRSPQFPGRWVFPSAPTFGTPNTFTFNSDIVINEIMYDARPLSQSPFAEDPEQWVEIYNRGTSTVDLGNWSFSDGIDFLIPVGTTIPAGGYLVVSNDAATLQSKWPSAASKILGDFSGNIRRGGERLRLTDAFGNPVNEVTFGNDSPWPIDAHGGGSSMELKDARADNTRPQAWASSSEAHRGSWQTYTFEELATPSVSNDPTQWNEFIFGLLD
ncbi:MAG TPA: lamin tail domain-containing protein, partial [Chthoniobacteraceae bacterium]|nr:lamin tail domain-containing protein [Chthoniobacteraceae bacterium]